jgi:hypothetical protein
MDGSFDTNNFIISLSFVQPYDINSDYISKDDIVKIIKAFGAKASAKPNIPETPSRPAIIPEKGGEKQNDSKEGYAKIGVIRNNEGESFVYYRNADGKIIKELE